MTLWSPQFAESGDEPALLRLLRETFGDWPKMEIPVDPLEHLRWKLEGGGRGGYRAAIVKQDNEIVGGIVLCIRSAMIKGKPVSATTGADVAVRAEYRQQGVLSAIQRLTLDTFGRTLHLTFGYQSDVPAVTKVAMNPGGQIAGQSIEVLAVNTEGARLYRASSGCAFRTIAMFDEGLDEFWQQAHRSFDFIPARTMEYLNWRYCDPRSGYFTAEVAEEGGRIVGYAVSSTSNGRGYLADVLALPEREDVVAALVERAVAGFAAWDIGIVLCWIPAQHPYRAVLARMGFEQAKRPVRMMYRPLQATPAELAFLGESQATMHFMIGDTDLV